MNKSKFKKTYDVMQSYNNKNNFAFDPLGSYTGRGENPTQDADDL